MDILFSLSNYCILGYTSTQQSFNQSLKKLWTFILFKISSRLDVP